MRCLPAPPATARRLRCIAAKLSAAKHHSGDRRHSDTECAGSESFRIRCPCAHGMVSRSTLCSRRSRVHHRPFYRWRRCRSTTSSACASRSRGSQIALRRDWPAPPSPFPFPCLPAVHFTARVPWFALLPRSLDASLGASYSIHLSPATPPHRRFTLATTRPRDHRSRRA